MFKLNIECTKDISFLKIDFSDGTSTIIEDPKPPKEKEKKEQRDVKNEIKNETKNENKGINGKLKGVNERDYLSTEDGDSNFIYRQSPVRLPEIKESKRPVKVASELQNLDI